MISVTYITSHKGKSADLERCIKSVIADARFSGITDFEHLVFLDGLDDEHYSTNYDAVIKDYRIKLSYSRLNRGKAACVNELIRISSGEFLFFLDSDDWSIPGRTRSQLDLIQREPGTILGSNYYRWDGMREFTESGYPLSDIDIKLNFWRFPFILYSSMCVRKADLVDRCLYFDENLKAGIDYEFYSRAFQELLVKNTKEYLVCYRVGNKGGITRSPDTRREQLKVHRDIMSSLLGLNAKKDSDLIDYLFSMVIDSRNARLTNSARVQLEHFKASNFNRQSRRYFKNSVSDRLFEDSLASILGI